MQANILLSSRIYDIKKRIRLLEWDISIMAENDLRNQKQKELDKCKHEFQKLEGLYNKSHSEIFE